jgi:glycerol-3-phosphate dehydrogenase
MKTRPESIDAAVSTEFDLLIVGGGIIGAGIAQNAASRGLSVCLLEKDDFASGASGKTTKLIHGGLRHLEQLNVELTVQLCKERSLLERLAPHMVRESNFVLPLSKHRPLFNLKAGLALGMYDLLQGAPMGRHAQRHVGQRETFERAPALDRSLVVGGLNFRECTTDDSRLVLDVVKSACNRGALALNYCQANAFAYDHAGGLHTLTVRDRYNGVELSVRGRTLAVAAGAWSNGVMNLADAAGSEPFVLSKSTHIVVPPSVFETNTALLLPGDDQRYVVVVPWQRALLIGTTDEKYDGDIESPVPTTEEVDYLLRAVNRYTATQKLERSHVIASFAGVGALARSPKRGGAAGDYALLQTESNGTVTVVGGDLTTYRLIAEDAMAKILPRLPGGGQIKPAGTQTLMLGGWTDKDDYLTRSAVIIMSARKQSLEPAIIEHLLSNYGADAQLVVDIVERSSAYAERICPDFPAIMAEIAFCVTFESSVSLQDLLFRRLRLGILHHKQCLDAAPRVGELMKVLLSWDDRRYDAELAAVKSLIAEHMAALKEPVGAR